jgi:hypothetical protein
MSIKVFFGNPPLPPRPEVNLRAEKAKPFGLFLAPGGGFYLFSPVL